MRPRPWESLAERSVSTVMATAECTVTKADRATACCTRSRAIQPLLLLRFIIVGACQPCCCMALLHGS